jgi:chromosomal replication initiator protein
LRHLEWKGLQNGFLHLSAPNLFIKNWIETHYSEKILFYLREDCASLQGILLEISAHARSGVVSEEPVVRPVEESSYGEEDEEEISSILDPRFVFEHFVVGKPNEFAYAAAQRVANCDVASYNPLFLYGPVGHGKTHLMHSIAHHILKRSNKKILYLSAEKFMYQFIKALRYKNIVAFKDRFRSVDVLMIDDVQFISGKESTQEEFFHTFNALVDQKRQVVISADKSPSDLEGIQDRMKSRLGWGLVADLHPTTYELRLGILQTKIQNMNIQIPLNVLELLAAKISSNVRELEGALNRLTAHAMLMGRAITVDMVYEVLKDLLRNCDRSITIDDIQKKVCEYYRIRATDMHSAKRSRHIVRPRQIAMFLAKQLTSTSLPNIGRYFGGRDHTTVMHAIQTIQGLLQTDPVLQEDLTLLRRTLETG